MLGKIPKPAEMSDNYSFSVERIHDEVVDNLHQITGFEVIRLLSL